MIGGITILEPTQLLPNTNLRPDQLVKLDHKDFILDVSVIHPSCPSYLNYNYSQHSLGCAENRATEKITKYTDLMSHRNHHNNQSKFIPFKAFIMETYGGINQLGQDFMKEIYIFSQNNQTIWTQEEIQYLLRFNLSVAIQRGNADLCRTGYSSDAYLFRRNSV